jgi:tetraacyldisaccharide 4'-kinase
MLPTGNLRESRSGAQRANIIIVTKCPSNLSTDEKNKIRIRLKLTKHQELYFTSIEYDDFIYSENKKLKVSEITSVDKLLLAGIAKPKPFFDYLKNETDECLTFQDHHHFTEKDIIDIKNKSQNKIIITTEKDYVRLKDSTLREQLYYLPIKSSFLSDRDNFDKNILNYTDYTKYIAQ